jgi:geranylgeranyl reductase
LHLEQNGGRGTVTPAILDSYDIVIIGAGPAGLQCAVTLGGSGMSVLLIEKKTEVGPKVCAGGLTALNESFALPLELTRSFDRQCIVLNGKERVISLTRPIRTIDRADLGRFQLDRVLAFDTIHVATGTSVVSIAQDHLRLADERIVRYRYLVGADGSLSMVRRFLKLESKLLLGMQYNIPGNHERMIWFFEPSLIKSGYAWIIPHRTYASAGVFFDPAHVLAKKAADALRLFLDRYGMEYGNARLEAAPINCLYRGTEFGKLFLAGDAAGLASAITGEGIAYALASGEFVAQRIMDPSCRSGYFARLLRHKKIQEKVLSLLDIAPRLQTPLFRIFFTLAKSRRIQKYLAG